jgi:hypothetical protein
MPKHLTTTDAANFVTTSQIGAANGVAGLGGDGKVPTAQLPASVTGAVSSVDGRIGNVDLTDRYVQLGSMVLNVKDFGALGDGLADDTTEIQAAVNAAVSSRKPLYIPPGTYTISSTITIPAGEGLTVSGAGWASSIKLKANANCFIFTMTGADTRSVFRDLELDGNCLEQGVTGSSGGINGSGAVACLFENIHFVGCRDDGLFLGGMTGGAFGHNNRIIGCLFDESMASTGPGRGITMQSNDENQIVACDFEFLGGSGGTGFETAVAILDRAGTQFITACNFVGGATNNTKGVRIQDASSTKITGSNFDGTAGDSIFIAGSQNSVVGNTIFSPGEVGTAGQASGIHLEWAATQNLIQGNSVASSPTNGKTRSLIREESMGGSGNNSVIGNVLITKGTMAVGALDINAPGTLVRGNTGAGAVGDPVVKIDTMSYNVKDYGAKGDNTTNDTAAIQATINACSAAGGGTVFFPIGTYAITPTSSPALTVPSNVLLVGANRKATVLRKNGSGIMISMSGPSTDPTGATHVRYSGIQSMSLNGNSQTGNWLRLYYADNLVFRDVFFTSNNDVGIDGVEFWDTRFYNCVFETTFGAADSITPSIWLRNSAASSGFGFSGDNVNQIYFHGCRWENFSNGALRIEQGVNNTNAPNGIYLTDNKMESSSMRGGAHLYVSAAARHVYVDHLYCFAGNFFSGYSTAQNIIVWSPQASALENVLVANGSVATVNSTIDLFSGAGSTTVLRNVIAQFQTAPTGVHLFFEASSTSEFQITNCYSNMGSIFGGTVPTKYAGNSPLAQIAGPVSDTSFTRGQPNGTLAIDTTNRVLYAKTAGSWGLLGPVNNTFGPGDHGLIAWTMDPASTGSSGTVLSAGFIYMVQVVVRQSVTITKLNVVLGGAGATLTANQCLAGLYDSAGNRVAITADMSTTWNSAGNKTMNLTASYSAAPGKYYIALLFNGTTSPTFACGSTLGATFTPGNANLAAGSYRWCRSAAGQTSLPSTVVLSGYTPDANNVYAAVA